MFELYKLYSNDNNITTILISLSLMLFFGFLLTRPAKKLRLPYASGYIIAGILIGPYVLGLILNTIISEMSFISDLALAFIAFNVGRCFKLEMLKRDGLRDTWITVLESLFSGAAIVVLMFFGFGFDLDFSLLLGAIAAATSPASTMMTIRQYNAEGEFVNILLPVSALDNVICLFVFSIVAAIISGSSKTPDVNTVLFPVVYNIAALIISAFFGFILSRLITPARSHDNRLILVIAMLMIISGICSVADISPLLPCMMLSAAYINLTSDEELYNEIDNFTPPILSLFFILSGMNLNISSLADIGIIGIGYFAVRIVGKYVGAFLGCHFTKTSKPVRNLLGIALFPQAGVAIGLAVLGQRILPSETGESLLMIILASSVLFELIGPLCAKLALVHSGAIPKSAMQSGPEIHTAKNKTLPQPHSKLPAPSTTTASWEKATKSHK